MAVRKASVAARPSLRPLILVVALLLAALVGALATTAHHSVKPPSSHLHRLHPVLVSRVWPAPADVSVHLPSGGRLL